MVEMVQTLLSVIVIVELSQLPWMYVIDRRSRKNEHMQEVILASLDASPDDLPTYDVSADD